MKLSILIPAMNEEGVIADTLRKINVYAKSKPISYEILVILNGCTDKSEEIVSEIARKNKNIIVLKSKPGYGYALIKGLKKASGNYIVVYNADFYDLLFMDLAIAKLLGKDMILGSKAAAWSVDKRSIIRKLITKYYNLYIKLVLGFKGSDTHGIKVMRRRVVEIVLPECKTSGGIFDTEFVIRTQRKGFSIMDFPVQVEEVRPSRFTSYIIKTFSDIYILTKVLSK